jgi:hypothetical protein
MMEEQTRIMQAASYIAAGMVAAAFAKSERGDLSQEETDHIVQLSVRIARDLEAAVKRPG